MYEERISKSDFIVALRQANGIIASAVELLEKRRRRSASNSSKYSDICIDWYVFKSPVLTNTSPLGVRQASQMAQEEALRKKR